MHQLFCTPPIIISCLLYVGIDDEKKKKSFRALSLVDYLGIWSDKSLELVIGGDRQRTIVGDDNHGGSEVELLNPPILISSISCKSTYFIDSSCQKLF